MAHFAELGLDNVVVRVIVVSNDDIKDGNGVEQEQKGIDFCRNLLGGTWVQTSYNSSIRKNFAGIGYKYDSSINAFVPPKPYASWTLNQTTVRWEAPVAKPTDDKTYVWNESSTSWIESTVI